jgi:hypothetical protein
VHPSMPPWAAMMLYAVHVGVRSSTKRQQEVVLI